MSDSNIPGHEYQTPAFEHGHCDYCDKETICVALPHAGGGNFKLCGCCLSCMHQDMQVEISRRNSVVMARLAAKIERKRLSRAT